MCDLGAGGGERCATDHARDECLGSRTLAARRRPNSIEPARRIRCKSGRCELAHSGRLIFRRTLRWGKASKLRGAYSLQLRGETTMARPPQHRKTSPTSTPSIPPIDNTAATPVAGPVFAQPKPTADPTRFSVNHPSDDAAYKTIDALNTQHKLGPIPFPAPRGGVEPVGRADSGPPPSRLYSRQPPRVERRDAGADRRDLRENGRLAARRPLRARAQLSALTRARQAMQIPHIIAGNGGHAVAPLKREPKAGGPPLASASAARKDGASRYVTPFRAPTVLQEAGKGKDLIRLENYDDQDFGYLRMSSPRSNCASNITRPQTAMPRKRPMTWSRSISRIARSSRRRSETFGPSKMRSDGKDGSR